jgi:hypothetical protein
VAELSQPFFELKESCFKHPTRTPLYDIWPLSSERSQNVWVGQEFELVSKLISAWLHIPFRTSAVRARSPKLRESISSEQRLEKALMGCLLVYYLDGLQPNYFQALRRSVSSAHLFYSWRFQSTRSYDKRKENNLRANDRK